MSDSTPPAEDGVEPLPATDTSTSWSNGRIAALLLGLVALIGGTYLAVSAATGGGDGPETAVEELMDAISDEDVIGVLASIDPEEREALEPGIRQLADQLVRIGVLADDFRLEDVAGADVEITDLDTETATLTDDLVAVTVVGGTLRATTQPDEIPVGAELEEDVAGLGPSDTVETLDPDDAFTLVAIRRDGWHVSIGYSLLHAFTVGEGLDFPLPTDGIQASGAASPTGAVEGMLRAGAELDVEGVLALLAPGESDALHAAAPLFLDEVQAAITGEVPEGTEVEITDLGMSEEDVEGGRRVVLESYGVSVAVPGEGEMGFTFDGECTTVVGVPTGAFADAFEAYGGRDRICASDTQEALGPLASLFDPAGRRAGVIVVERDGEWFVSPVRTMLDLAVQLLAGAPDDGFAELMEAFGSWADPAFSEEAMLYSEVGEAVAGEPGPATPGDPPAAFTPAPPETSSR